MRYLNTAPLIEGLEKLEVVELMPSVPARIVDLLLTNQADIGLASVVDAMRSKGKLTLLPVGMIGCDGPTLTVRVFSKVPFAQVKTLHVDTDSHTSVALARVIFDRVYGVKPRIVEFDARERVEVGAGSGAGGGVGVMGGGTGGEATGLGDAWPETVLLIGDKVVTDAPPADRYAYHMDLGEAWKGLTGLPFVYAMWMCRQEDAGKEHIRTAMEILERQRRHNATRLDWIVHMRAPGARWPLAEAKRYLGTLLRYEVGPREQEAVARFTKMVDGLNGLDGLAKLGGPVKNKPV